jgi:LacI family transcriptional regulator
VINNEPYVSEKTRARVLAIIEQERFSPNPAARALVTQRTEVIGVVVPTNREVFSDESYYFPTLLQGVAEASNDREYAMLLWLGQPEEKEGHFHSRILKNRLYDGLIIASATTTNPIVEHLLELGTPFVLVERPEDHRERISFVTVDNVESSQIVVEHLINQGRQRIATITGLLQISDGVDRLEGYRRALAKAGIPYDPALVVEGQFNRRSGYLGMKALLRAGKEIDAVFAASDATAIGALDALKEAGVAVPDEIALAGFDDLPLAARAIPPLTTIRHPIHEKGVQAANVLMDLIEGKISGPRQIFLPTQLVIRRSCGAAQSIHNGR